MPGGEERERGFCPSVATARTVVAIVKGAAHDRPTLVTLPEWRDTVEVIHAVVLCFVVVRAVSSVALQPVEPLGGRLHAS